MKINLNFRIIFLILFIVINSCRTESEQISENYYNNKSLISKIASKSIWKEDLKFIDNCKIIFEENYNQNKFYNNYGSPLWDYAMSMDNFDESFAVVPVMKYGNVPTLMKIIRKGSKIFFVQDKSKKNIDFFETYIKADKSKILPKKDESKSTYSRMICSTRYYTYSYLSDDGGVTWVMGSYEYCFDDGFANYIYNDNAGGEIGFDYGTNKVDDPTNISFTDDEGDFVNISFLFNAPPGTTLKIYQNLMKESVNAGGFYGLVNTKTSLNMAWNNLKSSQGITILPPSSKGYPMIKDGAGNIYICYPPDTKFIPGFGNVVGGINISSGPDSPRKIRFLIP